MIFKTLNEKMMVEISKMDLFTFFGLCRILKVKLYDKSNGAAKPFYDLFDGVMAAFNQLDKTKQKEIYKVVRDANRAKNSKEN